MVGIGDVRLSGRGDLLARARGTGDLYLLEATSNGIPVAPVTSATVWHGFDLVG